MLSLIWDWIKGLFEGKGTIQIGRANQSVSGITASGVAGPVVVGSGNVVNCNANSDVTLPKAEFEPTSDQKELLLMIENSPEATLMLAPNDVGLIMQVDCQDVYDIYNNAARTRWLEVFQGLLRKADNRLRRER